MSTKVLPNKNFNTTFDIGFVPMRIALLYSKTSPGGILTTVWEVSKNKRIEKF